MNEEEFEECSVVAYPHEIRFLHIKGDRISYYVDRHISDYVNKIQQENQKLKEMQCTFLGTGCQNKMKKYKEVIDKVNKLIAENSEKYWIDDEGEPKYLFNEIRDILSEVTNGK